MKKLIAGFVCACILGIGVNVTADCGGCGKTPAKKDEVKKSDCKGGRCALAKLKLTDDQKTKVTAAKAEFMKKLEGILTADQMKKFKTNCHSKGKTCTGKASTACGAKKGAKSAK